MSDNVIDIETKKPVNPEVPEGSNIQQWINIWKRHIKEHKAQAIAIIVVGEDGYAAYDFIGVNELDLLRICRRTKDLILAIDEVIEPKDEDE